jgi:ABC-type glycerol-3-phosphate transport system substrate-binding protein
MSRFQYLNRRDFLKIAGLSGASLTLAACAAPAAPGTQSSSDTSSPAAAAEELVFWLPFEEWGTYMQDEFNKAGLGITAEWQLGEYDENTKTMAALAAGNPPSISFLGRWQHPDLAARDAIVVLDDYVENSPTFKWENLWNRLQEEALFRGKKFVIPYTTDTRAFFYNKDVMAEAGLDPENPPTTWEGLHEQAIQVLKRDSANRIERIGFTPTFGNPPVHVLFFTLLWCTGQSEVNEDRTQATIATPEAEKAMVFIKQLMDDQGGYEAAGAFTRSLTLAEGIDAFSAGLVAFAMNGNWTLRGYAKYSPDLNFGMISGPSFEEYGIPANYDGGGGWYFFKQGPNVETAFKFADFVLEKEFMTKLCDTYGILPSRSDVGEEWAKLNEAQRRIFVDTAETVRWPALVPYYLELYGSIATMWDNVLIGGNPIMEELQIAQDAMQEILDKGAQVQIS